MTPLVQKLGMSTSGVGRWQEGVLPNGETLLKFAEYFDVSTDYLLCKTNDPTPPDKTKEPAPEIGSLEWLRQWVTERGIIEEGGDLTDEQLQIALENLENLVKILQKKK